MRCPAPRIQLSFYRCAARFQRVGQQQRTSIGRSIVKSPDILLRDEPTGALDYKTGKEILTLIETVNQKYGNTVTTAKPRWKTAAPLRIYPNRMQVNTVCLMQGALPAAATEIAIDRMYADNNRLNIGDTPSNVCKQIMAANSQIGWLVLKIPSQRSLKKPWRSLIFATS